MSSPLPFIRRRDASDSVEVGAGSVQNMLFRDNNEVWFYMADGTTANVIWDPVAGRFQGAGVSGIGLAGDGQTIAALDANTTPSGSYRFVNGTSTGTPPVAANGYTFMQRYSATFAHQMFIREEGASRGIWTREYRTSAWTVWERVITQGTVPGPYANDAAASAAGVAVGGIYRMTGGFVSWRQV